jgi:hypothetical protein
MFEDAGMPCALGPHNPSTMTLITAIISYGHDHYTPPLPFLVRNPPTLLVGGQFGGESNDDDRIVEVELGSFERILCFQHCLGF